MNGKRCKAAAPTGIAAANVEIEGTDVSAATIHTLFDLDTEFKSKLDFAKLSNTRVADLMALDVLLLDEAPILNILKNEATMIHAHYRAVSMMDVDCWATIVELLSVVDHNRRPNARAADPFGEVHVILFGDDRIRIGWS